MDIERRALFNSLRQHWLLDPELPVKEWHHYIGDPTIADAILDRIVHKAHQLNLKGESLRKLMNHKS